MSEDNTCPSCGKEKVCDDYRLCLSCTPNDKLARDAAYNISNMSEAFHADTCRK